MADKPGHMIEQSRRRALALAWVAMAVAMVDVGILIFVRNRVELVLAATFVLATFILFLCWRLLRLVSAIPGQLDIDDAVQRQKEFLRHVVDLNPSLIFAKDWNGTFVLANATLAELYSTTPDQLVGKTDADFNPNGEEVAFYLSKDREVMTTGKDIFIPEETITNCHGQRRVLQTVKRPLIGSDGRQLLLGVATDITERQQIQEELRKALDQMKHVNQELADQKNALDHHAIVAITDPSGKITYANDRFCQISKYARHELIGQDHRIINSGVHPRSFWAEMWRTVRSGQVWHGEVCNRAKDGSIYWVDSTVVPFTDIEGRITQYVAIRTDITRSKLNEQVLNDYMLKLEAQRDELRRSEELAEAANRAKSAFLANMSHEIRTPMTAIIGYADLMLEPSQTISDRHDCLQVIRRNANHLLELINDILDLSKIEADKMTLERIDVNLPQLVCETVSLMRPRALSKGLRFFVEFGEQIPQTICTDPLRLKQILINLLGNAIKFTATGGITLRLSCIPGSDASAVIRFEIRDTGIGMSPDQVGRLFQTFSQADDSTTRRYGGTGLGLNICKRLSRLLDGDITAESRQGFGSTFALEIRIGSLAGVRMLKGLTEAMLDGASPQEPKREACAIRGRILLAEDGLDNQRLISTHLRRAGAEVVVADNGQEAVDWMGREPFDLVLMDMQMPILDGYGATRAIRQLGHQVPIIALTAHALAEDRQKCIHAGCTDYMTKPIEREKLLGLIAGYLPNTPPAAMADEIREEPVTVSGPSAHTSSYADDPDMKDLVDEYIRRLPGEVAKLRALLGGNDIEPLRRAAHQLKGSGGGYGFMRITELAARADQAAKNGADLEQLKPQIDELIEYIRNVRGYQAEREQL